MRETRLAMVPVRSAVASIAVALLLTACVSSEEFRTHEGVGLTPEQRAELVAERDRPPVAGLAAGHAATLAELLTLVAGGSIDLAQVRAAVDQAAAAVDAARAALIPDLHLSMNVLAYAKAPGNAVFHTDRSLFNLNVDFSIPLDFSGRLRESIRAAQARYRSADARAAASLREQRFLATNAYFSLLGAMELRTVVEAAIASGERELKDANTRFESGMLRRSDVLVVEVTLSNSRQRKFEIESTLLSARRALNLAVGLPIDHVTEVAEWPGLLPVAVDALALLERARRENPEVDVLIESREALLHELASNDASYWPDVSVGPRASWTTESTTMPAGNVTGFVSISWNPDFSGRIAARSRGLESEVVESALAITGLLRRLEERILRAHRTVLEKQAALRAAETSVVSARENLRILEEQLRAGVATGREVVEAQALLTQQAGVLATSRHEANLRLFEAAYVAGRDPLEFAREVAPQ